MRKKIITIVAAAAIVAGLFGGCGSKTATTAAGGNSGQAQSKIKVGLTTDEGGVNDKSFNQSADTGLKKAAAEFGIDYKAVESAKKEDYESNMEALVNSGDSLTFGIGFQMATTMKNVSEKYKDKFFAAVDVQQSDLDDKNPKAPIPSNLQLLTFKEQEGSFLMGVIAGKMTKTNKIGFIGGKDFPLITKFEVGFAAGVKAVNPEAAKGLISADGTKPGNLDRYVDTFTDTNKGYEAAKALYGEGCDVIYHAAGGVGIGMFKAAKELKDSGKNVWTIGVDLDQAVKVPEYKDVILSSMIKKVDAATYNAAKEVKEGKFQGGKQVELGLKEGGVDIAPTSSQNTPKEILDLVEKYKKAISEGKITVPSDRKGLVNFTVPTI